jgi:transcriptional regulator of acetoin/glycerol metabolism
VSRIPEGTLSIEAPTPPGASAEPFLFGTLQADRPLAESFAYPLASIDEVLFGRGEPTVTREDGDGVRRLVVRVPDSRMSSSHARLKRDREAFTLEDLSSKNGSIVNGAPQKEVAIEDGDLIELGCTFFFFRRLFDPAPRNTAHRSGPLASLPGVATLLPTFADQLRLFGEVAASNIPLLIRGESGTGKELLARAAHELSRRSGALVPVNCGALPANLIEAELFGHRKGAFSGATEDRPGLVRASDRGTLLLDEIGELPAAAQAALLRVIQEREVMPIGAVRPVAVDLRIVCATHRDLDVLVERGTFRADLFARINGFQVRVPPLRERREDLGLLIAALLRRLAPDRAQEITFSGGAARRLLTHRWPLNVRELEKCLAAALIVARGRIEEQHLQLSLTAPRDPDADDGEAGRPLRPLSEGEQQRRVQLIELLQKHHGNISAVARELGKERVQIRRWLKLFQLRPEDFA